MTEKKSHSEPYDERGVRALACAVILQAYLDLQNESEYLSKNQQMEIQNARESAVYFFNSRTYRQICSTLGIMQPEKIKIAALK